MATIQFMLKNINCIPTIAPLEGIEKVKTEKITTKQWKQSAELANELKYILACWHLYFSQQIVSQCPTIPSRKWQILARTQEAHNPHVVVVAIFFWTKSKKLRAVLKLVPKQLARQSDIFPWVALKCLNLSYLVILAFKDQASL